MQVSMRDFRNRQATFLNMADRGERVVIKRGDKAYAVTPITEEDPYFTPEMLDKIDRSLQEAKEGKVHHFNSMEELDKYVDRYGV